jgi:hypothetical protein
MSCLSQLDRSHSLKCRVPSWSATFCRPGGVDLHLSWCSKLQIEWKPRPPSPPWMMINLYSTPARQVSRSSNLIVSTLKISEVFLSYFGCFVRLTIGIRLRVVGVTCCNNGKATWRSNVVEYGPLSRKQAVTTKII